MSVLESFKKEGYSGYYIIPIKEAENSQELSEEILSVLSKRFALSICGVVSGMDYALFPLAYEEDVVESVNFNLSFCKESVSRLFKEKGIVPFNVIPLYLYSKDEKVRYALDYILSEGQKCLEDSQGYFPSIIYKDGNIVIIEVRLRND